MPITSENAARQYQIACELLSWLKAELICLFAWVAWGTVQVALGKAEGLGVGFVPAVVLFQSRFRDSAGQKSSPPAPW